MPQKAIALISGGLDSLLAAKVMLEQGIHVEGTNCGREAETPVSAAANATP